MMMIPGTWEPRRPPAVAVNGGVPLPSTPKQPVASAGGGTWQPAIQRPELPNWLKLSLFTATLVAAMWLAMTVFFESPHGLVL
jgi:hypothetical protein